MNSLQIFLKAKIMKKDENWENWSIRSEAVRLACLSVPLNFARLFFFIINTSYAMENVSLSGFPIVIYFPHQYFHKTELKMKIYPNY